MIPSGFFRSVANPLNQIENDKQRLPVVANALAEPPCSSHQAYTPEFMTTGVAGNLNACFQACLEHHMTLVQSQPPHNLSCGLKWWMMLELNQPTADYDSVA